MSAVFYMESVLSTFHRGISSNAVSGKTPDPRPNAGISMRGQAVYKSTDVKEKRADAFLPFKEGTSTKRWRSSAGEAPGGVMDMKYGSGKSASAEGFLLLNTALNPIFVNRAAAEILSYPQKLESHKNLDDFLANRVRTDLIQDKSARPPKLVSEFQSGRRVYQCRSYRVSPLAQGDPSGSLAIILERGSNGLFSITQVAERFHLTTRETEVLQYLLNGLTTKQIASGMEISPNTVKAFLRMIMVKMGVSTRSGIVGKAFSGKL
jgi:DNA-binding CsgD family transcriptional regulator